MAATINAASRPPDDGKSEEKTNKRGDIALLIFNGGRLADNPETFVNSILEKVNSGVKRGDFTAGKTRNKENIIVSFVSPPSDLFRVEDELNNLLKREHSDAKLSAAVVGKRKYRILFMKRGSDPRAAMLDLAMRIQHKVAPRVQVWESRNSDYMSAVAFTTEDIPVDPKSFRFRHLYNGTAVTIQQVPNRICCSKCADFGHLPKDCKFSGFRCKKCSGPHNSAECHVIQSLVSCWICKTRGDHWSTDCPSMIEKTKKKTIATLQTWADRVQQQQPQQQQQQQQNTNFQQEVRQEMKKQQASLESNAAYSKKQFAQLSKRVETVLVPLSSCDGKLDQVLQQLVDMQRQINQQRRLIDELRNEIEELKKNRAESAAPAPSTSSSLTVAPSRPITRSVSVLSSSAPSPSPSPFPQSMNRLMSSELSAAQPLL